MKRNILIYFISLLTLSISAGEISDRTEKAITDFFGPGTNSEKIKIILPPELRAETEKTCKQKFFSEYLYVWKVYRNDSLYALAILDNVYGKSQPITFLVLMDSEGSILSTSIIKYREQHGYQVKNRSWNEQFEGKHNNSPLEIGRDIDSISGATISAISVSKGIKKITQVFHFIKENL